MGRIDLIDQRKPIHLPQPNKYHTADAPNKKAEASSKMNSNLSSLIHVGRYFLNIFPSVVRVAEGFHHTAQSVPRGGRIKAIRPPSVKLRLANLDPTLIHTRLQRGDMTPGLNVCLDRCGLPGGLVPLMTLGTFAPWIVLLEDMDLASRIELTKL